jgi:hypothetical protein
MFDLERFDELAKGLATNRLSRGRVIKSFVAGVLLAGPLGALWNSPASAQQSGTCSVASRCPKKEYCSADQGCICVQSAEGDIRCGKIPTSCNVKLCQTSADCADLGEGYFCDTPNSGCCTNPPAEKPRCIAPCDAAAPCPPERVCGTECCPEGQSCIDGVCSEETPIPCADDPVTAASLDAADSALAAGAREVNLSPNGCIRYRRTLKGGRVTSEEVTLEGKPALVWKHTPTKSTGQRDADLDGFFEWRSTVRRGAATAKDDRTVTTEYSPVTKTPTRQDTYTRGTGKGWHVLIQEADQSGTLVTVAEFDTGPYIAASAPRDQGSGGDLPNGADRKVAPNATIGISGLTTIGCRGQKPAHLEARLRESRNVLIKCQQRYGAPELANAIANYNRPIVITCANPAPGVIRPGALSNVEPDSVTGQDWTVRITVNNDPMSKGHFFEPNSQREQASTLGHEMLHLSLGVHNDAECPEACQQDPTSRVHHDRTYACENLCFGAKTGQPPTKCSCDKCLGTPPGQKCNERCKGFGKCPYPSYEKRCTFPTCPPPKSFKNGVCQPPPGPGPGPGPQPGNKIYCNCNKKCYDDPQVCLSECKPTLGCFTGICGPAQPGQC